MNLREVFTITEKSPTKAWPEDTYVMQRSYGTGGFNQTN